MTLTMSYIGIWNSPKDEKLGIQNTKNGGYGNSLKIWKKAYSNSKLLDFLIKVWLQILAAHFSGHFIHAENILKPRRGDTVLKFKNFSAYSDFSWDQF